LANLNFWLFWLHLAMAVQAFVLARSLRLGWWSWAAAAWFGLDIAMDYALAPIRYAGQGFCMGTKPITVPCEDVGLLVAVTVGLWLLGVGLAWWIARGNQGRKPAPAA
jgi:hypothetical protein